MEFPQDLEVYFQTLTDITDRVARMNSHFDATPAEDIADMVAFTNALKEIPWETSNRDYFELFSSYFTFHLKIVEEIIKEAREILDPENRLHVKRLVAYTKDCDEWFLVLKKKKKSSKVAVA